MTTTDPFVSILTPVYNGEKYLAECIESVLAQRYQNWEYVIVNNCSTDKTLEIVQYYAKKDKRIKVVNNTHFVSVIENHNIAFGFVSEQSIYCKVISADDWIYPECLSKMVALAETYPSVNIVGSYQLRGNEVKWKALPNGTNIISGREVCRSNLLDNMNVFGNPTSSLYRADLIRKNTPFFPHLWPHSDTSAFLKYLQFSDYGFVHEILSVERIHNGRVSTKVEELGMCSLATLDTLLQYGPIYLSTDEFEMLKNETLKNNWRWLGGCLLKLKGAEFWRMQASRLRELGYPLPWSKVIKGAADEFIDEMHNPKVALNKLITVLKNK
jgi:glycosyltransferase involved in cell wall biosynthesis